MFVTRSLAQFHTSQFHLQSLTRIALTPLQEMRNAILAFLLLPKMPNLKYAMRQSRKLSIEVMHKSKPGVCRPRATQKPYCEPRSFPLSPFPQNSPGHFGLTECIYFTFNSLLLSSGGILFALSSLYFADWNTPAAFILW